MSLIVFILVHKDIRIPICLKFLLVSMGKRGPPLAQVEILGGGGQLGFRIGDRKIPGNYAKKRVHDLLAIN